MIDLNTKIAELEALRPTFGDVWVNAAASESALQQIVETETAHDNIQVSIAAHRDTITYTFPVQEPCNARSNPLVVLGHQSAHS